MKNLAMIMFALVLLLATLGADGKQMTLDNNKRNLLSDQASTLGRKPDVGAKDAKDPAANNKGAATAGTAETNGVGEHDLNDSLPQRWYGCAQNPYTGTKNKCKQSN